MRCLLFYTTSLLLLTVALADAQPPRTDLKWMGRAKPSAAYDIGDYRAVKGSDGKTRFFPRLSKHTDLAKLAAALPASCDWSAKAKNVLARMYANDRMGCCVISSRAHQLGFWTGSDTGMGIEATDTEIINAYRGICGPGDNGCNMSAVNQYQQQRGIMFGGVLRKTRGSAAVDNSNKELIKGAIFYGGGLNLGFSLPDSWFQSGNGSTWDVTNTRIVGGHEVQVYGYNDTGVLLSTWGGWRTMTWAALTSNRWVDETYVTLSADWYGSDGLAPNGVDVKGLEAAFAAIAGGDVPTPVDPVPVPPIPVPPVPVPPSPPGKGFTGVISVTTTYKDGVQVGPPVTTVGGTAGDESVESELKAAGVSPVVIADVLKLLKDIRARAGREVIMADILKLLLDLGLSAPAVEQPACCGSPDPQPAMFRREDYLLPFDLGFALAM